MTGETKIGSVLLEEFLLHGGMGLVAIRAGLALDHRHVRVIESLDLGKEGLVAAGAKVFAFGAEHELVGASMRAVAPDAILARGVMHRDRVLHLVGEVHVTGGT